jgi:thiaminase/transcriptional activator TenA
MKFTEELWQHTLPIYHEILQHPFIQGMIQGTLSQNVFSYYLQQDVLYLIDFARALALTAVKAPDTNSFMDCLNFAKGSALAEMSLHQEFLHRFSVTASTEKSISCLAYTQFLLFTATQESFAESMAALLPCFWIYREVGCYIKARAIPNNPYQLWIDTYAGVDFDTGVEKAIAIIDQASQQASLGTLKKMKSLFKTSTLLELDFWHSAYYNFRQ